MPSAAEYGLRHEALTRERERLRRDLAGHRPAVDDQGHVSASDGTSWVAHRFHDDAMRIGLVGPEDLAWGSWMLTTDPSVAPTPQEGQREPSPGAHLSLKVYLSEYDPVAHAAATTALGAIDDQDSTYGVVDELLPWHYVDQRLEQIERAREHLAHCSAAPDTRHVRAWSVDPAELARTAAALAVARRRAPGWAPYVRMAPPPHGGGAVRCVWCAGSPRDGGQLGAEVTGLVGGELDDETAAALERDAHDDAATLLGDLERAIARTRLHGGHAAPLVTSSRRRKGRRELLGDHYP